MNTDAFLSTVLPAQGKRALACFMPDGKTVHRWFDPSETASLLGFAAWALQRGANVYYAVGGYVPDDKGEFRRKGELAERHRCLRLDVDCGPGKPYPDKREGAKALAAFMQALKLPNPTVVDSGGGLHVYWTFDRDIDLSAWLQISARLKFACEQYGFAVDPVVTRDAARILRLPGTYNLKFNPPALVRVLCGSPAYDPAALEALLPAAPAARSILAGSLPASMREASVNDELAAGRYQDYTVREVLAGCPGMRAMFMTGGATAKEPLWKAALDLINKAGDDEGVKARAAVAISKGHPQFSNEGLAHKWSQVQQQDYHPPTCSTFASLGMAECAACPLRHAIKSPVSVGRVAATAFTPTPPAPAPQAPTPQAGPTPAAPATPQVMTQHGCFMLGSSSEVRIVDGLITKKLSIAGGKPSVLIEVEEAGEDGKVKKVPTWAAIIPYRLVSVERLLEATGRQMQVILTFDAFSDGLRTITLTNTTLHDGRAFAQALAGAGLSLSPKQATSLRENFMADFLTQLQRLQSANLIANRCGWTDDYSGFVLGTQMFTATGVQVVHPSSDSAAASEMIGYRSAGSEQELMECIQLAMTDRPERQALIALSIATPLMAFAGVDGVILNAWSQESGVGKSTLSEAGLAIWGSPKSLRKDFRDTANATWKLAAVTGNLPMVVDEFTNVDGRALSDYVYTVTQGREKHRLTSAAALNGGSSRWCLAAIMTANTSILEKLQHHKSDAEAEAARVFELRLSPLNLSPEEMAANKVKLQGLKTNYGFLGEKLAKIYVSRSPEYWTKIVMEKVQWWDAAMGSTTSDRFRSVAAALMEVGAMLGKMMGLPFNTPAIVREVKEQWKAQQAMFDRGRRTPRDFVTDFITENLGEFAIIGGTSGNDMLSSPQRTYRGEIRGQSVNGKFRRHRVVIPFNYLRDYVKDKNGNVSKFQDWLEREQLAGGVVMRDDRRGYFMAGQVQQVRTRIIVLNPEILGDVYAVETDSKGLVDSAAVAK